MKRQKNSLLRQRRVSTEPQEEQKIIQTPPSDAKLRLLLSGYNHDSCFVFKIPACKYNVHSPKNDHNLSLQLEHENFRPDVCPEIFKANRVMLQKKLEREPEFQFKPGFLIQNNISSLSPTRRKGRFLNPSALPVLPNKLNTVRKDKLKDIVRRKSCHCRDCGDLSKLEKKIMHLPPEPRRHRPGKRRTRNSDRRSKTEIRIGGLMLRRGSSLSSICSKQLEAEDAIVPDLEQVKSRYRTFNGPKNVATPMIKKMEKVSEDKSPRLFPEKRPERATKRKVSEKRPERNSIRPDKLSQTVSSLDFSQKRTPVSDQKKIEAKRVTPVKSRFIQASGPADKGVSALIKKKAGLTSSRPEYKKSLLTERINTEGSQKTVVSTTTVSKDVLGLKNLLSINTNTKPLQRIAQTDRGQRASPIGLSLSRIKIKHTLASLTLTKGNSLPQVTKEGSISGQRNDSDVLLTSYRVKTVEREREKSKLKRVRVNQIIRVRNRSQLEYSPYKADLQTSKDRKLSRSKTQTTEETFAKNLKLSTESKLFEKKGKKKKNKKSKGFEELWKNCMQSAFRTYQENFNKNTQGSQSSQITQEEL